MKTLFLHSWTHSAVILIVIVIVVVVAVVVQWIFQLKAMDASKRTAAEVFHLIVFVYLLTLFLCVPTVRIHRYTRWESCVATYQNFMDWIMIGLRLKDGYTTFTFHFASEGEAEFVVLLINLCIYFVVSLLLFIYIVVSLLLFIYIVVSLLLFIYIVVSLILLEPLEICVRWRQTASVSI